MAVTPALQLCWPGTGVAAAFAGLKPATSALQASVLASAPLFLLRASFQSTHHAGSNSRAAPDMVGQGMSSERHSLCLISKVFQTVLFFCLVTRGVYRWLDLLRLMVFGCGLPLNSAEAYAARAE